jgi:hypothetical protein
MKDWRLIRAEDQDHIPLCGEPNCSEDADFVWVDINLYTLNKTENSFDLYWAYARCSWHKPKLTNYGFGSSESGLVEMTWDEFTTSRLISA